MELDRIKFAVLILCDDSAGCDEMGDYFATEADKKTIFVAFPWVVTSTGPRGFMVCVFII